jgi:hypothetical protein
MAVKEVKDYDLFVLSGTLSTTATPLTYYGQNIPGTLTPWTVPTPESYTQKIYKMALTNTGTGTATITLTGASTVSGSPTLTLLQVSVAAGATVTLSEEDISIILPESYYLQGAISTGSGYAVVQAYFIPGSGVSGGIGSSASGGTGSNASLAEQLTPSGGTIANVALPKSQ